MSGDLTEATLAQAMIDAGIGMSDHPAMRRGKSMFPEIMLKGESPVAAAVDGGMSGEPARAAVPVERVPERLDAATLAAYYRGLFSGRGPIPLYERRRLRKWRDRHRREQRWRMG